MHLIDTHAHLYDEAFVSDLPGVLQRAAMANVRQVINVATTAESSESVLLAADSVPGLFASAGIHPNYANLAAEHDFVRIVELIKHPKVVAIGETGLDRYWDDCPWDIQTKNFIQHLELASSSGLPVIIHTRDCYPEMIQIIRQHQQKCTFSGVMHSFAGSVDEAMELVRLGMFISFAGMLTFKKSELLRQAAAVVPLDRLLVETDSPYLSPEPYRGKKPNEPARVVHTASALASIHSVSILEIAQQTTLNARRLFAKMSDDQIL